MELVFSCSFFLSLLHFLYCGLFFFVLRLCFAWLAGWLGVWDSFQADGFSFHSISFPFLFAIPTLLDSCCSLNAMVSSNILDDSSKCIQHCLWIYK